MFTLRVHVLASGHQPFLSSPCERPNSVSSSSAPYNPLRLKKLQMVHGCPIVHRSLLCNRFRVTRASFQSVEDLGSSPKPKSNVPHVRQVCVWMISFPLHARSQDNVSYCVEKPCQAKSVRQICFCFLLSKRALISSLIRAILCV